MKKKLIVLFCIAWATTFSLGTTEEKEHFARLLSNPVANLKTIPFQYNYQDNMGHDKSGKSSILRIQPVVPFSLNEDWNIISRTIIPVVNNRDLYPEYEQETGLGDIEQSFYFSPKVKNGVIWGVGPMISLPTASETDLGNGKVWLGPTGVVLHQTKGYTVGALGNTQWPVSGEDRDDETYARSYIQPFAYKHLKGGVNLGVSSESSYDWTTNDRYVPMFGTVSKLVVINGTLVNIKPGIGYYVDSPDDYNSKWIFRFEFSLLLPK